jgi:RimJ/RimL family protein N-acetyltransferase
MTTPSVQVPILRDGDVVIRTLGEQDLEGCYEQCVDPESVRWTHAPTPYSHEMAREFCLVDAPRKWADDSEWVFALEAGGAYAGNLALRNDGHGRAEIAYGAHPSARGTGVVERGVRLLLEWGFAERGLSTVTWRAKRGNWASRKLAWRLGFTLDGVLRHSYEHRGRLGDAWIGTLLAGEERRPSTRWLVPATIDGDGVRLRPLREDDVARVVEACSDERTQHWLGQLPAPYTEADARAWMEMNREGGARGTKVTWAIADRGTDVLLGAINAFDVGAVDCEIGYWAHPDARGRGMMTAAMRLATAHAFEELGVRRVRAAAALDNAASRHVIEAAGLTQTGIERLGTVLRTGPADVALYDVLSEEWPERSAASARRWSVVDQSRIAMPATDSAAPTSAGARKP